MRQEIFDQAMSGMHWLSRDPNAPKVQSLLEQFGINLGACRLLDIGCSTGKDMEILQQVGIETFGLDPDIASLKPGNMVAGKAEKLPFQSRLFHAIIGLNVLFWLDLSIAIPEMERVLQLGGLAIVTYDVEIVNLETGEAILQQSLDDLASVLTSSSIVMTEYEERVDNDPGMFLHVHKHFWVVLQKK